MSVVRSHKHAPGSQEVPLLSRLDLKRDAPIQPIHHPLAKALGDVLHHQYRQRKISRQLSQKLVQRRWAAGRSGDGYYCRLTIF